MNIIFYEPDILFYTKSFVDIVEYHKLSCVSKYFHNTFEIKSMIDKNDFKSINNIYGCNNKLILHLIDKNVRNKFSYRFDKKLFDIFYKNIEYNLLTYIINIDKLYFIEYLIEILYHSINRRYYNLIKAFDIIYEIRMKSNDIIYHKDFVMCAEMFICIINSKRLTHQNTERTKILCKITSMITTFLFIKFENVQYVSNKKPQYETIYKIQNDKLMYVKDFMIKNKHLCNYPQYFTKYLFEKIEKIKM